MTLPIRYVDVIGNQHACSTRPRSLVPDPTATRTVQRATRSGVVVADRRARRLPRRRRHQGGAGRGRRDRPVTNRHHQLPASRRRWARPTVERRGGAHGPIDHQSRGHADAVVDDRRRQPGHRAADAVREHVVGDEPARSTSRRSSSAYRSSRLPASVTSITVWRCWIRPTCRSAHGPRARVAGYMRPIEPRPIDAPWLGMALDWFPPASFSRVDPPVGGISISYTIHIHRTLDHLGDDEWLGGVFHADISAGGIALEKGLITDPAGTHPGRVVPHPLDRGSRAAEAARDAACETSPMIIATTIREP